MAVVWFAVGLAAVGCGAGGPDSDVPEGAFPTGLETDTGTIHLHTVEYQADTGDTSTADIWLETSTGNFLAVQQRNSETVSVAACDGTRAKKYDVSSHQAYDFTVEELLRLEPEALASYRGSLAALQSWAMEMIERSGRTGESAVVEERAALHYASISQGDPASSMPVGGQLDLLVDAETGLPLQAVVYQPDGELLSRTEYDYEITAGPEGGFDVAFPEGYYVQTDRDLGSPGEENMTITEAGLE